ncbi:uncharacterized protein BT62DRAFT_1013581 [Guyanagaster necrorhizus]|uniref:Uncharacterized protein n=1 Tax=Guyanagaster necrorhizus TaxID=856835 RepID=A0A9P8ALG6_9AGAR|nr:uncharacterized protein BT62DRAFT_1013581 [Guyanagaster necrorhizus MCA 3950]KAG7439699.1 hypothetical protein BT62DRAFT_1013581 [Guyanagaster necrorhizus MCA 3950]
MPDTTSIPLRPVTLPFLQLYRGTRTPRCRKITVILPKTGISSFISHCRGDAGRFRQPLHVFVLLATSKVLKLMEIPDTGNRTLRCRSVDGKVSLYVISVQTQRTSILLSRRNPFLEKCNGKQVSNSLPEPFSLSLLITAINPPTRFLMKPPNRKEFKVGQTGLSSGISKPAIDVVERSGQEMAKHRKRAATIQGTRLWLYTSSTSGTCLCMGSSYS